VLDATQPDILHVHSLLNLSFELPALARARGIPVVATLHDYTLVCPSGGQRIHRAERHVCDVIDSARCARCFPDSPFFSQAGITRLAGTTGMSPLVTGLASRVSRRFPLMTRRMASLFKHTPAFRVTEDAIDRRLTAARRVLEAVDLCVAPSQSIATEFQRLGLQASKLRVSDYGFAPLRRSAPDGVGTPAQPPRPGAPLRIGYVGTLVWHKGVHVLLDAVRRLPASGYELRIFGDATVFPDYAATLRALAAGHPVRFMGPFESPTAGDVYDQIDLLVVPSLWLENSPLVIHEAFLAHVPVVGARIGGIAELVTHGRNGLLYDPPSADALAAALAGLMEHPERLTEFRQALPAVKTISQDAQEWEGIYKDLLHGK
jgi:glycosyltransferase involved in cell wall biosynthesis